MRFLKKAAVRTWKKKSSYRMKELWRILCEEVGDMSYNTFEKYYRCHDRLTIHQSGLGNPRVRHADLEQFLEYIKQNPINKKEF